MYFIFAVAGWYRIRPSVELQHLLDWRHMKGSLHLMTRWREWLSPTLSSEFSLSELIQYFLFSLGDYLMALTGFHFWVRVLRLQKGHKYCLLGRLASEVGWNYYDTIRVGFSSSCFITILCFLFPGSHWFTMGWVFVMNSWHSGIKILIWHVVSLLMGCLLIMKLCSCFYNKCNSCIIYVWCSSMQVVSCSY